MNKTDKAYWDSSYDAKNTFPKPLRIDHPIKNWISEHIILIEEKSIPLAIQDLELLSKDHQLEFFHKEGSLGSRIFLMDLDVDESSRNWVIFDLQPKIFISPQLIFTVNDLSVQNFKTANIGYLGQVNKLFNT